MALLNFVILDSTINDNTSGQLITVPDRPHWILINDEVILTVKTGSIQGELVYQGKGSLNFVLINPAPVPLCGQTVKFIDRGKLYFGGFIQSVTLDSEPSEVVKEYSVECVGWEGQLERTLVKRTDTNTTVDTLIRSLLNTGGLLAVNGFTAGLLETSPVLVLVDADYVRASEYLRDIATAGGGSIEISPEKVITFRKLALREAPFDLTSAEPESVQVIDDIEDYCNQVVVDVRGTSGATANVTRSDSAEIAKRQALEGGSGVYEVYERVEHPLSNDVVQLARLGVSVAWLILQSHGRLNNHFTARLRRNLLDVGQLITCNVPGMTLDGQYQITRMGISDEGDRVLFDIEGTFTNRRQVNLDSLLRIARAAKSTIIMPTNNFQNVVTFLSSTNWNVPGTGTVQVEIEVNGAGGGGGGGGGTRQGGNGAAGGRGVSFREYAAGTTLTITIGLGGALGVTTDGSQGGQTWVSSPTESRVAEGFAGRGGKSVANGAAPGAAGLASGDYEFIGAGAPGGQGGIGNSNSIKTSFPGVNGNVIIRY